MAVIDDYFFELEDRINRTKNKDEMEVLVEEARKLYFPPEGGIGIVKPKYKGELQRHYIDKRRFLDDLKDIGTSYYKMAKSTGLKNVYVPKFKGEDCVTLSDKDRKNIMEFSGLDIMSYTKRTEAAGRQPLHQIKSSLIREGPEAKGLKAYKVSEDFLSHGGLLPKYLREGRMPLHIAMELCDIRHSKGRGVNMDILTIILAISIGGGLLMASFPAKLERKEEKHRIVRKLRAKAHHMDIAKDAKPSEKQVLESLNTFLHDIAKEVEKL